MSQIVWTARPDGTVDYIGQNADEYSGIAITASPAERWISVLHPDEVEQTLRIWSDAVQSGQKITTEYRVRRHDNCYRWHLAKAVPIRDKTGTIVKWYGTCTDIHDLKEAENKTKQLATRLAKTLESITDGFFILDHSWAISYANKEAEYLLEVGDGCLAGRQIFDVLRDKATSEIFHEQFNHALQTKTTIAFEELLVARRLWLEVRAYPFEDGLAVYMRDVSERKEAEAQLKIAATGFEHMTEGLVIMDRSAHIVSVNPAFTRMTGYTAKEAIGKTPRELLHEGTIRHDEEFFRQIAYAANTHGTWSGEIWSRRKDGQIFPQMLNLATVRDPNGNIINHVAVLNDITQVKEQEAHLVFLAHRDSLTQLPNRVLLLERLEHAKASGARNQQDGALLFLDLDNFNVLNDSLGHDAGDLLLRQVAMRLMSNVRGSDTVARLGGDEFVVMIQGLSCNRDVALMQAKTVAEKTLSALRQPFQIVGEARYITASVGITLFSDDEEKDGELLKRADLAMYQAKAAGGNTMSFFDPVMQSALVSKVALEAGMRQALQNKEFYLCYQPQVGRDSTVVGAEALVRWKHPRRGIVPPFEFIPVAEESGLIIPLGNWILEAACKQIVEWNQCSATAHLSVAVNVSAKQFRNQSFVDDVLDIVERTGVNPKHLKLELTESLLVEDVEDAIIKMTRLKEKGVNFSLDDFGTGYSSLVYLKRLPLDQLKIDQSFVREVLDDPNDAAIARTIIALAKNLGLKVVAEGVETLGQHNFLSQYECDIYQGYLFSPPLVAEQFISYVEQSNTKVSKTTVCG